jgi:long-chain fatty acid transport protein
MLNRSLSLRLAALSLGVLLPAAPQARAAGFAIFEQGARGMGLAGAYVAQTQDASAIFHNAAGIAFLKGKNAYFGATLIAPSSDFAGANPFPGTSVTEQGDAGIVIPPAVDYSQQISERLAVGFGVHVPYGLRTRWANKDTTYSGRFLSKMAELQSFSFNPTVAFKLADRLAVGGGFDVRLSRLELDRNVAAVNPFTFKAQDVAKVNLKSNNEVGYGWNLGLVAMPIDNLSLGVAYRHKVKTDFKGYGDFSRISTGNSQLDAAVALRIPTGAVPVTTQIEFPSLLSIGGSYRWNDWTLAAQIDFHGWSSFDSLPLTFEDRPDLSSVVEESYKNTQIYRLGAEWRMSDTWEFRGGYFYDKSPAPAESVSPLLPDADRHGLAAGATWRSGRWRVEAANWFLLFKERSTEGRNRDGYDGTYKNSAELFAISVGVSF